MALLGLLFFVAFFYLLIALINPKFFTRGLLKTRKLVGISSVVCFVLFVVFMNNAPSPTGIDKPAAGPAATQTPVEPAKLSPEDEAKKKAEAEAKAKSEAEAKAAAEAKAKEEAEAKVKAEADAKAKAEAEEKAKKEANDKLSIGMTPEQFRVSLNKAIATAKYGTAVSKLNIESGEMRDTFQIMLFKTVGIVGIVNKVDGSLREAMLIGSGDGTPKSGTDFLISMGFLISATNPTLSADERGNILKELGLMDDNIDLKNHKKSTVKNGIKYTFMGSDTIGMSLIASNEKQE